MKLRYKTVMFLILIIFCVGSVCAADHAVKSDIQIEPDVNTTVKDVNIDYKELYNKEFEKNSKLLDENVKIYSRLTAFH